MIEYGLVGRRLPHSYSVPIHRHLAGTDYRLLEMEEDALADFFGRAEFRGVNVTIPYKETVIPLLDHVSEEAREVGAVNTVVKRDGALWGYNTDVFGMEALFQKIGARLRDATVLILGTGGTAHTARYVAKKLGAARVVSVSRTPKEGEVSYADAPSLFPDASYLVNTTPVGMFPKEEGMPIDPAAFPRLSGVVDAVYNPLRTRLVLRARECGIPATGGLLMLVAQAARAAELFGRTPRKTVEEVYAAIVGEKENTVLIGMPSSGKSTVGRLLAERLSLPFFDTDEETVREAGMPVSEIFRLEGEEGFRKRERETVARLCAECRGAVIATGGGAPLFRENLEALKRNGRLYFLDRPLPLLLPTPDRPLALSEEAMTALYEKRYPLYLAAADVRVDGGKDARLVADEIEKERRYAHSGD